MIVPIPSKYFSGITMILQIKKNNDTFDQLEEISMKCLASILSLKLDNQSLYRKYKDNEQKYLLFPETVYELLLSKSQVSLSNAIRKKLPKFYSFENAELLLCFLLMRRFMNFKHFLKTQIMKLRF